MSKRNCVGVGRDVGRNKIKTKVDTLVENLDQPSLLLCVYRDTTKIL